MAEYRHLVKASAAKEIADQQLFAQANIDPELETVTWPNGSDLALEFLYQSARILIPTDVAQAAPR